MALPAILIFIIHLLSLCHSSVFTTGLNDIIPFNSEADSQSLQIRITIDNITDEVEIYFIRIDETNPSVWNGFGFDTPNMIAGTYAIILDYDPNTNQQIVNERTLGRYTRGTQYNISEIEVLSDTLSTNNMQREVHIKRPRIGTFTFPLFPNELDQNGEYKMNIIAAIGPTINFETSSRHQSGNDDRNTSVVTFVLATDSPTVIPTENPTETPTEDPTVIPSEIPTSAPTEIPVTLSPVAAPVTAMPTLSPLSNEIICDDSNECSGDTIDCEDLDDMNDGCLLKCNTEFACENTIYNCDTNATYCNIECKLKGSCLNMTINCGDNTQCNVIGMDYGSLYSAKINSGINTDLIVNCSGTQSCNDAMMNGLYSNKLIIDCNEGNSGCKNIKIFCPPLTESTELTMDDIKNCKVIGIGFGSDKSTTYHDNLKIFATNSWNDIDLSTYIDNIDVVGNSQMICGKDIEEYSCLIANPSETFEWNCIDTESACYVVTDNYNIINCNEGKHGSCYDKLIDCNTNMKDGDYDGCKVRCNAPYSCSKSQIKCASDKFCEIECNADHSCDIDPDAIEPEWNPTLWNQTQFTTFICPDNSDCSVTCNGGYSCNASLVLLTGNNNHAVINVNGQYAAQKATIYSVNHTSIEANCNSLGACFGARFGALNSSELVINCLDQQYGSCRNTLIMCPEYNKTSGNKYCRMNGGGKGEVHVDWNLFCINSWNDIDLDGYVAYSNSNKSNNKMWCTDDYSESCEITYELTCDCKEKEGEDSVKWGLAVGLSIAGCFALLFMILCIVRAHDHKNQYDKLKQDEDAKQKQLQPNDDQVNELQPDSTKINKTDVEMN